jgi:hypothetical protein
MSNRRDKRLSYGCNDKVNGVLIFAQDKGRIAPIAGFSGFL